MEILILKKNFSFEIGLPTITIIIEKNLHFFINNLQDKTL